MCLRIKGQAQPEPKVEVNYTREFKRNTRQLAKRYRNIRSDLQALLEELALGSTPGDRIQGVDLFIVKVRLANSDAGRGKSGGYRVIYWVSSESSVTLITIYSKSDQDDISADEIKKIVASHGDDEPEGVSPD